jgi:hypothetical protein
MSFSSNPFFSNNLLRRCLGDEESGAKAVTTDIQWKDSSHNLTVKVCACKACLVAGGSSKALAKVTGQLAGE